MIEPKTSGNETKTIDNSYLAYTLESELKEEELTLILKCFDIEEESMDLYKLVLSNETITEEMRFVFENIHNLYGSCFKRKENY